jgi:hypothetical protein
MSNDKQLLEQALEALRKYGEAPRDWACIECVSFSDILKDDFQCEYHEAITAIRARLEQPEQEPVAWFENLKRLASICPELNMVNYSNEDVDDLNFWAIEVATCIDGIATPPAQPAPVQEEPVYHLRQYGDVTKEQLDRYMATGDINLQPTPVKEPVIFYRCNGCGHAYEQVHPTSCDCMEAGGFDRVEYYTTPPATQRQWVGLTQDEFRDFASTNEYGTGGLIRAIEAKLKEKNT